MWDELLDLPHGFTLYGGTAIALHLGHRESVDFDFFCFESFVPLDLVQSLPCLEGSAVTQTASNTLSVVADRGGPVHLSFFGVPRLGRIAEPHISQGNQLPVAALIDLAGTKAATVQQRAEAKDYIDLDAMLADGIVTLPVALGAACAIYGDAFVPELTLKALTWFDEPGLAGLSQGLKIRLIAAVRAVDLERIPNFAATHSAAISP